MISVLRQRAVLLGADWSWLIVADCDLQVKRYDCIDLRMRLTVRVHWLLIREKAAAETNLVPGQHNVRVHGLNHKDRKSTRLNSSYVRTSRMPSSA